jgi:phosphatidylglycerol:prolipoprotein diacylglycerol transferase
LYESILDLVSFIILVFIYKKFGEKFKGLVFFSYLVFYAIIRFFIEQIRIDSALNVGSIPIAQIVSVILLIIGISGIIYVLKPILAKSFSGK